MRALDIVPLYLRVHPRDIALIKFVVESYEGIAIVRTVDKAAAVIVLLVVPDFLSTVRSVLDSLADQIPWEEVPPPLDGDDARVTLA
ncbi:MAG TPA: DUF4911 domain-containing protein [Candidatus Binatia bacterium]|nr:DUF4911 domain-containing protein [Candidatus Binatia bacterium]